LKGTINGRTVPFTCIQGATVPLNLTGLPGLSMRLEAVSPVRGLHPSL
jgi:hypothetical protein